MRPKLAIAFAAISIGTAAAQQPLFYEVFAPSELEYEMCLGPCDCAMGPIRGPLAGTFTLILEQPGPLFNEYRLQDVRLSAEIPEHGTMTLAGSGQYRIGGEVLESHQIILDLDASVGQSFHFDSGLIPVDFAHPFPEIAIAVESFRPEMQCTQFRLRFRTAPDGCPADFDDDGSVGLSDLSMLLHNFGKTGLYREGGDLDADHDVDLADLAILLSAFGERCP